MLKVNLKKCPQDHKCPAITVCPVGAISQKDFNLPVIDNEKCIECLKCTIFCPKKAIENLNTGE